MSHASQSQGRCGGLWQYARAKSEAPRFREHGSTMSSRHLIMLATMGCSVATAGCGNPPGLYPVTGKILHKGEPASGAVVYFHPESPTSARLPAIPSGIVDEDGSFSLSVDNLGNGCPPGKYTVLVEWRDSSGDGVATLKRGKATLRKRSRLRSGPDRLNGRYLDIKKPMLHAEVLTQSNNLAPFQLED
jgi:hypothetical protein